jgi:hypothetical protein
MHFRLSLIVAAAATLACVAVAAAQPNAMGNAVAGAMHPIQVNKCDPTLNGSFPGYTVGYYPRVGPYGWYDVYGVRYMQPVAANAKLGIDYVNVTQRTMSTIEFGLIARGRLVAEVRDVGTFSPNAEIKHEFGISPNVFPLGTGLPLCVPLRITFSDGATWRNPHLPAIQRSIYR